MSITRARMAFAMNAPAFRSAAPVVPWTPLDLGAKLKAWWTAVDVGTDDGGGLISAVPDRVGGKVMTATTTARPTRGATSFNSAYPGWTFNGTSNCFELLDLSTLPTGATAGEIWVIASNTALPADASTRVLVRYGAVSGAAIRNIHRAVTTGVNRGVINDGSTSLSDTVMDFSGPHIIGANWAGTVEGGRFDGVVTTPATATIVTLATGTARMRIGATVAITAAAFHQGVVSDVFAMTTLTVPEREKMEGWGAWNKGLVANLPALHTYKSAAP